MTTTAQPSAPSLTLARRAVILIAVTYIIGFSLAYWEKSHPFDPTGHIVFLVTLF